MIAAPVAAILMYHHVSDSVAPGPYARALTVGVAEFAQQVTFLRQRGCSLVGQTRLVEDVRDDRIRSCEIAMTFDDGYDDAWTHAAPELASVGATGTFFVTTGYVGSAGHLTRAQVHALAAEGMEVGDHTVAHVDLTKVGSARLEREVDDARASLRALTGQPIGAFAYPSGKYDAAVERAVRSAGCTSAVTTAAGRLTPATVAADPFALPRYRIEHGTGMTTIARVLAAPSGDPEDPAQIASIARARSEGNSPEVAESIAVALLSGRFPEPILKVRVDHTMHEDVAGIMLSGQKFHAAVDRSAFVRDAAAMVDRAFAQSAAIGEVDVWAVLPVKVAAHADVSGDLAIPTDRTVFSAAVLRAQWSPGGTALGTTYFEPGWLQDGTR